MTGATIGVIATLCIYRLLIGVAVAWAASLATRTSADHQPTSSTWDAPDKTHHIIGIATRTKESLP